MSNASKKAALKVITTLHQAGHQALLAGGCVRDMLLDIDANDYDVATSAHPGQVAELFRKTLMVGAQFGVVVVIMNKQQVEVATFRNEAGYADGRRPDTVHFTNDEEDALRRDFTINGMFFDPIEEKVIDYVGGRQDLAAGIIRAIGNPVERFTEDHLRMLRAVRFAARFDYQIEPDTFRAICDHSAKIKKISAERIAAELEKILTHPNRLLGMQMTQSSGLLQHIFPHDPAKFTDGINLLAELPNADFALALAALLINFDTKPVQKICRHLKLSNDVRKKTSWLLDSLPLLLDALPLTKGRLKLWLANEYFDDLLTLAYARARQASAPTDPLDRLTEQITDLGDEPVTPTPLLDGNELMALGIPQGPLLGKAAADTYLAQLEGEFATKSAATEWVKHNLLK